ncbi:putative cytochrome P450 pisatin demethylase [Cadophora sp. MPI-SDFR-AT-0126]|nr:putative cytochrome P450 pisatin demethylase [Leotiomycetes sp. MPI-SDFR-AT-0126]
MHTLLLFGCAILSFLLYTVIAACRSYTSTTRSVPGPWIARFTRLWYFNRVRNGSFHLDNVALHERHGPIVRVAPGWFSIAVPDKAVYGIGSKFRKSDWYEGWKHPSPERWTLFPDQDIKRHAETRKRFQSLYSMSSLLSYEHYVNECNDIFFQRMSHFARTGEPIDMVHWFQCFAFDVMGAITYSTRFGLLDRGEDIAGVMAALDKSMVYSTLAGIYAWAHPYLYTVMEKIPGSGAAGRNYLMSFVNQKIETRNLERRKSKGANNEEGAPRDFLDKLTDAHEQDPGKVTPYHIFMMGMSNIVAGSDTTAISLSSVLLYLLTSPTAMTRLRSEVDAQGKAGGPTTFKIAHEMPYLRAVIKEALRLHPATGLPLWRIVPKGGAVVAGQRFEAGTIVGLNSWVAHYDRSIFGDDADVFRPERWLQAEEDPDRYRQMEAYYMPFGLGSRTCLGRHVSTLEMCKLVPELIGRFDFELAMPESGWNPKNYWFVKPEKLLVRVKLRATSP